MKILILLKWILKTVILKKQFMAVKDLSRRIALSAIYFNGHQQKADWEKFKLTDEQVSFFNENGFLAGDKNAG